MRVETQSIVPRTRAAALALATALGEPEDVTRLFDFGFTAVSPVPVLTDHIKPLPPAC